jgi:hypothetical protein
MQEDAELEFQELLAIRATIVIGWHLGEQESRQRGKEYEEAALHAYQV